jgi:hypothetical protein
VVVIQGIFDAAGQKLLDLKPVRRYSYNSKPIPDQPQGQYKVTVTYTTGAPTIVPFDALVADDAGHTAHGFFEVTVPLSGEIAAIRITDASGQTVFATIEASEIIS